MLTFLENKLRYLGIYRLPASSTLSDVNCKRPNEVFGYIYYLLLAHHKLGISQGYLSLPINGEESPGQVKLVDSTTISLFTDILKGTGRDPISGKKKGGLKAHAVLPLDNMVPELIWLTAASTNDKDFLGQLKPPKGSIYVFDKGYVNYSIYKKWTDQGAFFVTRLNENAKYEVISTLRGDIHDFLSEGTILQTRHLKVLRWATKDAIDLLQRSKEREDTHISEQPIRLSISHHRVAIQVLLGDRALFQENQTNLR